MSNLKYKVGDKFKEINPEVKLEFEIKAVDQNSCEPYNVKFYIGEFGNFKTAKFRDVFIDKYYTKIKETKQIGGNHYSKLAIEPYEYSIKNELNCYQFNVVKYVTRYKDKNGVEDLKKAIQTLQKLIEHEEKNN